MKLLYSLVNILIFLIALPTVSLAQSSKQVNDQPKKTTNPIESMAKDIAVQISADHGRGSKNFTGSGVLINKEGNIYTVLSAAHTVCEVNNGNQQCLDPAKIELTTSDGESYTSNEVKEFPLLLDLVLIKFRSPFKYPVARMGDSTQIKRGDQLFSSGYTKDEEWNFYNGKLIANTLKKLTPGGYDLLHDAKTKAGMSGGGVYNNKGELVCINSQVEKWVSASSCVPITFYREFDPQIERVASELYLLGKNDYYRGSYNSAVEYLNQSIAKDPTFADAYFLRGECYYEQEKYKAALTSYKKANILNPSMAIAYRGQGKAAYSMYDYSYALENFQKASELQPKDALTLHWQGLVFYDQEKYDQAIKILEQAVVLDDDSEYAHDLLGSSYEKNTQIEQALASYSRAIEIGGSKSKSLPLRAKLYLQNKSYEQAVQDYDSLLEIESSPKKLEYHWLRSTALIEVQNYSQALVDMDEIIQINENYKPAYLRKAQIYAANGEYDQAVTSYSNFIDLFVNQSTGGKLPSNSSVEKPPLPSVSASYTDHIYDASNAVAYRGRGLAYLQQKKYKNVASDLQIAAELYRQDGNLEEEQFCLNTINNLPKTTKPTRNVLRRK
jgi:tetratricopeptide (TPR) repeat protein